MLDIFTAFGYFSAVYLLVSVFITAKFYPGYSHSQQFMSELAAIDSPTQKLSPKINNYPLALMFCLFGLSVLMLDESGVSEWITGSSIILHGIATAVAGYYCMDKDPYISTPSITGQVHGYAGLLVMLSLFIAPVALLFSPRFTGFFHAFSIICLLLSLLFLWATAKSYHARKNAGLYQRLSYGAQLFWLAGLSAYISIFDMFD